MSLIKKYTVDHAFNRLVNWGIFKDDIGAFSTEFQG
jgi:hypothetical protein